MTSIQHRLKNSLRRFLRRFLARLNTLGLWRYLRRSGKAKGGGIVMTHCIGHVPETAYLPPDMKTSEAKVEELLRELGKRGIRVGTVRELVARLDRGDPARDFVAFSMDDGYRDNLTVGLPLLKKHGASGTVYVETGVVETRRPTWMHRYFFIVHQKGEAFFAAEYMKRTREQKVKQLLENAVAKGSDLGALYDFKRVLKYEADLADRERVTREILAEMGGSDESIAKSYLTWDEVKALEKGGVEIGAHTVHHEILSRLDETTMKREIGESTATLRDQHGLAIDTFAYPFGRAWDYNPACVKLLSDLGYKASCAAMEGTNDPRTPRMELKRLALNDDIPLDEILAELDGAYDLARRVLRVKI